MPDVVLKVATYNANSIRTRLEQVLEWLGQGKADVLCIQETKVQDKDFPQDPFREAGYHVVFRGQKAHGGVAIVSRREPQDVSFGFDDGGEPDGPQGRSSDSEHFQYKLEWLARMRALFERHYAPDAPLLWVGDFNVAPDPIDVHDPKRLRDHVAFHPDARGALERVREWGFVDVFRLHHPDEPGQYSFWDYRVRGALDRGVGWRVDHVWATEPLARRSTGAWIDVEARRAERPSDHTFLVAEFAL
jgi:exodeoxyribonuclease-3